MNGTEHFMEPRALQYRLKRYTRDCHLEGVLEWISKKRLASIPKWKGDEIFLRLLDSDAPFFSLKLRYKGENLVFAALNGEALDIDKPFLNE